MTYRVETTDNNQLMICTDGDVICLSDGNVTIDELLTKKFNIMCEALNKAEPTGAITKSSELVIGETYWNSHGFKGSLEPYPITILSEPYTLKGLNHLGKFITVSGYAGGQLALSDRAIDHPGHNHNRLFRTKEEAFKHWGSFQ